MAQDISSVLGLDPNHRSRKHRSPYSTDTARALQDAGFLVPLRVYSNMEEIRGVAEDALRYLASNEGAELFLSGRQGRRQDIHLDKLSTDLVRLPMHWQKFGHEILTFVVSRLAKPSSRESDWVEVDEGFALFYMTLLANRLAGRVGAALLTPIPTAERLAITARFDAQLNRVFPSAFHPNRIGRPFDEDREYEAFGPRRPMPRTLAPGLLSQLAIRRLAVDPETPIDDLLRFRGQHKDELAQFQTKIEELASAVEGDLPVEALRQRVLDLYTDEVEPAISTLKEALKGQRVQWLGSGLIKIAFLSAGSSTVLAAAGLDVPTALLAGAGLSLIVSGMIYNVDKKESIRSNPYSYLLSLERELT